MKKVLKIFLFFFTFTISLSAEIFATVNGESIRKKDLNDFVIKSIPGASYSTLTDVQKKSVLNQMIERKLYLEDAKRIKVEDGSEYQEALKRLKENLILDYWMKKKVEEIVIPQTKVKKYYKHNIEKFTKPASVKVRHILLEMEDEAIALIAELELSSMLREKFIALAHSESVGPSAINGGSLDWFTYEQMVPEFSEAAFSLTVGSITKKAIKTQFGYHVILLEGKKEKGSVAYELVQNEIVKSLRLVKFKTKLKKLSKRLKQTASIIVK